MGKIPVLFVDDEMIVRVALNSIVNWSKTEFNIVGTVSNGKEALEFIESNQVSLVVTDLKMPEMDGIELVKRLYESKYEGKIIILTSYGEFEYARQAIRYGVSDYLLKATFTESTLLEAMRDAVKNLTFVDENEINDTMDCFEEEEVRRMLQNYDYSLELSKEPLQSSYVPYYIFMREKNNGCEGGRKTENKGTKEMLASLIQEVVMDKDNYRTIAISNQEAILICKLFVKKASSKENPLEHVFMKLRNSVRIYMNTDIGIVKCDSFSTKEQMQVVLRKGLDISKMTFYEGYQSVLTQELSGIYINELNKSSYETILEICSWVLKGQMDKAIEIAADTLHALKTNKIKLNQSSDFIKRMFQCFFLTWSFYFDNQYTILDDLTIQYNSANTIEEYIKVIKSFIKEISESPIKVKSSFYRSDIRNIMEYIKMHSKEKILLSDLARVVNFTESYISRLFKNEVGMNLLSYINMQKMEQAMLALLDKNVLVKEVANQLGYEEQSYFNKMFNKYFGKNPSDMQSILQNCISNMQNSTNNTI